MQNIDLEVLRTAVRWRAAGHPVTLVTVTRTWGSSPRPVGAMLALRGDGVVSGSVSGGCIEDDLSARARNRELRTTGPEVVTYGVTADEAHRFGLPCGGTLQLVLEPVTPASGLEALLAAIEGGGLAAREVHLADGSARVRAAAPGEEFRFDGQRMVSVHGPRWRLLLIGAGQLSRCVSEIATGLDYEVTVCDPREEYVTEWQVPGTRLRRDMPDDAVQDMRPDARLAVVALTHDPKLDDLALIEALRSPAFYVGAIGSRANNRRRRERLREFDVSEAQLDRLHGPVGIWLGSRTPAEIAISILAEIIAARNGIALPPGVRIDVAKEAASAPGCTV